MLRSLALVMALTGCTFYISGGSDTGDAGSGSDAVGDEDGGIGPDVPDDTIAPPDVPPDTVVVDTFVPPDVMVDAPPDAMPDAMADAMPDAPNDAGGWLLETIQVRCNGNVINSQTVLAAGSTYRIRASGQCKIDSVFGNDVLGDAEYQGTIIPRDKDNGVDTGVAINDTTLGGNKLPHWGNYTTTHIYEVMQPGQNGTISLRYHDKANNAYGDNSGSLTIEIFAP